MMNVTQYCVLIGCLLVPAVSATSTQVDGVAAYANTHVITYSDVLGASRELQQMLAQRRSGTEVNAVFQQTLDELINRKLILDAYDDQREIKIPDAMVEERMTSVIRDMFSDDRSGFLKALSAEGQSEQTWRDQIREQMVVSAMHNLRVDSRVRISPVEVRGRYDAEPEKYAKPSKVKFSMLVIAKGDTEESRAAQAAKLKEAQLALTSGEAFADVAKRFSEDVRAGDGGERDWVNVDMLREELRDAVMSSTPGTVSDVIEIGKNYSLVKVDEREVSAPVSFQEAYVSIEREIRLEKSQQLYHEWIALLKRDAFVRVLNENPF